MFANGKILIPSSDPLYSARSDIAPDDQLNIGDVVAAFFGTMLTPCQPDP